MSTQKKRALIVENTALSYITEVADYEMNFVRVSKTCEAVVCCRLRPGQKADVVNMIKKDDKSVITLAIGDGANDCSMISKAHVGIGIAGREGMQAARSSDFAIGKFKFLHKLLFMHGREAYRRNGELILFMFYKNVLYVMVQFMFGYYSVFSG